MFEADWVIGTDGARSTVRKLAGLPFEGFTWPDRFVATNIEYPFLDYGFCNANMVVDPVNWAVIGRLGRETAVAADLRRGREPRRGLDPRAPARALRGDPARSRGALPDRQLLALQRAPALRAELPRRPRAARGRRGACLQPVRRARPDRRGDRCRQAVRRARRGDRRARRTRACSTSTRRSGAACSSR